MAFVDHLNGDAWWRLGASVLAAGLLCLAPLLAGEEGAGPVEIIIDDGDPGTSAVGAWSLVEIEGAWQDDIRIARPPDPGDNGQVIRKTYTYDIPLSMDGTYEVQLWWFESDLLSSEVTVSVTHDDGIATETVNQQENGSQWNLLGTYSFTEAAVVQITAAKELRTAADGVRLVLVDDPGQPPEASIVSIAPNPATVGGEVTFDGTGTDEDGEVIAYLWESDIGGFLSDQEDFSTTSLVAGLHTVSFSVQDDDLLWSQPALEVVEVQGPNQPPVATIVSVLPNPAHTGTPVAFDGSSMDSDGNVIAYLWESDVDGTISTAEDFFRDDLTVGPHNITYAVQDDDLEWSETVSLAILIEPLNQPPVASIASISPNPATSGVPVSFDGSSTDIDGLVEEYLWESDVDGIISITEDFSKDDLTVGPHNISYRVRDDDLEWSETVFLGLVIEAPNQPPLNSIIEISPNPADAGVSVNFDGSSLDPDGEVIAYLWESDIDGVISTTEDFSKDDLTIGPHNITYTVQDDDLEWSLPISQTLDIETPNQPPIASIVSVSPNPAEAGATVSFDGSSLDPDGDIIAYLWESDVDGTISTVEDFSRDDLTVGPHNITYTVQDDDLVWSPTVSLGIDIEPPNQPPTATIVSVFPSPANVGTLVTFDGESSDPDGEVIAHRWESNLDGELSTEADFSTSSLTTGIHTILFLAQDDDEAWSLAAVLLLAVDPEPNQPPVATVTSITPNPATEGDSVVFLGTGDDPDGLITSYHWESDADGILSTSATFATVSLSVGPHVITFRVQDDDLEWSSDVTLNVDVNAIPNQLPTAQINSLAPNPAEEGTPVLFSGTGIDLDGNIVAYEWESNIVGEISTEAFFSISTLPTGSHLISFRVQDDDLDWSVPQTQELEIHPPANTNIFLVSPPSGSLMEPFGVNLEVQVDDPEGEILEVRFHGRVAGSDEEFTIVAIPDTQIYVDRPQFADIFTTQTQWIADNVVTENIVFVTHEGDVVDDSDDINEWLLADTSMSLLDDVVKYGISPGNHDTDLHLNLPPGVTGTLYNDFFPLSRYENYPWYGGSFPAGTNWNSYQLFSASGIDFIIVHLQFCPSTAEVAWADSVLSAHPNRKAIITTHGFIDQLGNRSINLCEDTQYLWNDLVVPNDNVFFVLCGHMKTEFLRTDSVGNRQVHQMLANYQNEPNGGDGWLRLLRFAPAEDTVHVSTYSPWLDDFRPGDAASFSLNFPMRSFSVLDISPGVASGSNAAASWPGLSGSTQYEWFVSVVDENGGQIRSPIWTFSTEAGTPTANIISVTPNPAELGQEIVFDGEAIDLGGDVINFLWESDQDGVISTELDFSLTSLSVADHVISFSVQDNELNWSEVVTTNLLVEAPIIPTSPFNQFRRGDSNRDGAIDLSDGSFILNFLFIGGTPPPCRDAADTDDSGELDISDGINVFNFLFAGTDPPPSPGPFECGSDPTEDIEDLTCESESPCT